MFHTHRRPMGASPRQYIRKKKCDYESRREGHIGEPGTIQKRRRKGGYKSRDEDREGPEIIQEERRNGGYKSGVRPAGGRPETKQKER